MSEPVALKEKPSLIEQLNSLKSSIETCEGWTPSSIVEAIAELTQLRAQVAELTKELDDYAKEGLRLAEELAAEKNAHKVAHGQIVTIHKIAMDVLNCPPIEESDCLTVKKVKSMAWLIKNTCGDYQSEVGETP